MSDKTTRRSLLKASAGVAPMVLLAGCNAVIGDDTDEDSDSVQYSSEEVFTGLQEDFAYETSPGMIVDSSLSYKITEGDVELNFSLEESGNYDFPNKEFNVSGKIEKSYKDTEETKRSSNISYEQFFRDGVLYQNPVLSYQRANAGSDLFVLDYSDASLCGKGILDMLSLENLAVVDNDDSYVYQSLLTETEQIDQFMKTTKLDIFGTHSELYSVLEYLNGITVELTAPKSRTQLSKITADGSQSFENADLEFSLELNYKSFEEVSLGPIPGDAKQL